MPYELRNLYHLAHIAIRQIIEQLFAHNHYHNDNPLKTQKIYEMILTNTKSLMMYGEVFRRKSIH